MRYYVIINGVNSLTKTGLAIKELPSITKPLMRTQIEEIDGRDGDIITELGYSAYDKELEIGLYGEGYDINDIIAFFNNSGTIVFSNESDKYYNFKIIDQIDYEKLLKFKTAIIKIHVQPFKYPLIETPIEITEKTITVEGENLSIDNTMEAPIKIDLKGNTYQYTTTGKNLLDDTQTEVGSWGADGSSGTNIKNRKSIPYIPVSPNTQYTISTNQLVFALRINEYNSEKVHIIRKQNPSSGVSSYTITTGETTYFLRWSVNYDNSTTFTEKMLLSLQLQLEQGDSRTSYEKYTGGNPSPSPDYPEDIQVVSGNNTIKILGKNIFNKNNATYSTKLAFNNDYTRFQTSSYSTRIYYIECAPNTTYSISKDIGTILRCGNCNEIPANNVIISSSYSAGSSNQVTFTTNSDKYIYIYLLSTSEISTISYESVIETLQVEANSTVTPYEEYQEQSFPINLPVKNLFDDILEIGTISSSGSNSSSTTNIRTQDYTKVLPNTIYTIGIDEEKDIAIRFYNSNKTFLSSGETKTTPNTFTTPNDCEYVRFVFVGTTNINDKVMLEEGSKANSYTPFGVEPIELCKLGDFQDYLFKDNGKWYKHKEIGKKIFIGNNDESWVLQATNTAGYSRFRTTSLATLIKHTTGSSDVFEAYCNIFTPISANDTFALVDGIASVASGNIFVYYDATKEYTLNEFKNWLSTNNLILYYQLSTPINEEITDTTLLSQLNSLESAIGYDNQTNIIQSNADLPFILNVTAFLDTNLKATINNIGNIYSKPILDIKATGIVGIYLEGNQIFSVDLSNDDECIIDTNRLEAYDPATQNLMNRKVTGDYNLFKLNIGNNNVSATGDVDKITVTNYTRWL